MIFSLRKEKSWEPNTAWLYLIFDTVDTESYRKHHILTESSCSS